MTRDRWQVECIGSLAIVTLWQKRSDVGSATSLGTWLGSVIGNDAFIVTQELRLCGLDAKCRLVNPTRADLRLAQRIVGPDVVQGIDIAEGELTRSICVEDMSGRRSWIMSRVPNVVEDLGSSTPDVLYLDYYPELVASYEKQSRNLERSAIFMNLSALPDGHFGGRTLAPRPTFVQASVPEKFGVGDAERIARCLLQDTSAQKAFVTLGRRAAVLSNGSQTWCCKPSVGPNRSLLGAGATFSSRVIVGLGDGLDGAELLESSVSQTALRLEALHL